MAPAKTERLMNLTICLLSTDRYLTRSEIRSHVQGYGESDQGFERTFERDKEELAAIGIPIEIGSNDVLFDDEQGYRIPRGDFTLPAVEFTADEAAVLGLASRAWREVTLAGTAQRAVAKLRAAGVEVDSQRLPALEPVVTAQEPGFGVWYDAVFSQTRVSFTYGSDETRIVEPWGLTQHRGRWYGIGWDTGRQDQRMFRLSRIDSPVRTVSRSKAYTIPEGTDIRALARALDPQPETENALVAVRPGRAAALRRRGRPVAMSEALRVPEGFELYGVGYGSAAALVGELCSYGADVVVLEPAELRAAVLKQLREVAA